MNDVTNITKVNIDFFDASCIFGEISFGIRFLTGCDREQMRNLRQKDPKVSGYEVRKKNRTGFSHRTRKTAFAGHNL